jgi:hypothetical protein
MSLELHSSYTAEALRLLGFEAPVSAEVWFRADFEDKESALFLTLDHPACWCPPVGNPNLCFFYSPSQLRLGVDRCRNKGELLNFHSATFHNREKQSRVHLFASLSSGEWCYLGRPVLGSGFGSNGSVDHFSIGLDVKLPERLWHEFGGYRGWIVYCGKNQLIVQGAEDADELLTSLWGTNFVYLEITRYDEDAMSAVTDANDKAVVMYHSDSVEKHSANGAGPNDDSFYVFPWDHDAIELPRSWVISRQEAIDLIRRYLDTGAPIGLVEE